MNNTYAHIDDSNAAEIMEPAWWTVRRSLLATFVVLSLVLVAMVTPTPLAKWAFGDRTMFFASR